LQPSILIKTTDGGQTWQRIFTPGYTSDYWWIDFLSESYGFIAANGKVLRTIDGGLNWEIIQAGDSYPLFSIDVIDSLHIAAAGYGGTGYPAKNIYSSDGGYTWINGGTVTTHEINCIKYIDTDIGYIVMSEIGIYKTTNRGQNWNFIPGIEGVGEYELSLLPENTGYSAGTNLKIYKTENGYDYWKRLIINDNFSDVFFVDEQKGFVISSSGFSAPSGLYKTIDSGISWEKVSGAPNGVDLLFLDSITGFIGSNLIYKTTDGGISWYVPNGGQGGAGKIFFINETTGWAVRSNVIYKTTDRGENWFTQFTALPGVGFNSILFVDSLYGWTANFDRPFKTINGGLNWIQQINLNIWGSRDIYFKDSLNGWIINDLFELLQTTNSGINWFTQLNTQYVIRSFGWLSSNHGFIVGDGVYETIDSGSTWNEILELRNIGLRKFQAPENYVGYSSGYLGLIYKYVDTTIVPVELTSFKADIDHNIITLIWSTSTETNNLGFKILRSEDKINWEALGFIEGNGTSTLNHNYKFIDQLETSGIYYYKLKQLDYNGNFNYSNFIEVNLISQLGFELYQNFPNPFNNSTKIVYQIPKDEFVTLKIYDVLGNEIRTLIKENKKAGYYTLTFSAVDLSSGMYFYILTARELSLTRKFILLK